jgi:hypothetical protein
MMMSFPRRSLAHEIHSGTLYATIGSLVMVYRKDGRWWRGTRFCVLRLRK